MRAFYIQLPFLWTNQQRVKDLKRGALKSRDLTTRDWTTRHQIARVDIARVDNAAQGSGVPEQSSAGRLIAAE